MSKKIIVFCMFVCLSIGFAQAQSFTSGSFRYTISSVANRTVTVYASSTSISGAITIPSSAYYSGGGAYDQSGTFGSYTVTKIGSFAGCTGITQVTIPSTITEMNSHAFDGCTSLTTVYGLYNLTEISDYGFKAIVS